MKIITCFVDTVKHELTIHSSYISFWEPRTDNFFSRTTKPVSFKNHTNMTQFVFKNIEKVTIFVHEPRKCDYICSRTTKRWLYLVKNHEKVTIFGQEPRKGDYICSRTTKRWLYLFKIHEKVTIFVQDSRKDYYIFQEARKDE